MNSLPDIEEVKDKSVNKGCGAVRVYRMLPAVTKKKVKRSRSRDSRKRKVVHLQRRCSIWPKSNLYFRNVELKMSVFFCVQIKIEDTDAHEVHSEMTQENTIDSTVNLGKTFRI